MRRNLGKILTVLFLLFSVGLQASTYKWSAYASKKEAYVNEAIYLKYVCEFSDRGELYTIDFNPKSVENIYNIELLKKSDYFVDGKRVSSFEYIAYAKTSGELEFEFDLGMKKTTLEFIVESTGSRDDDRGDDDFSYKVLRQKSLSVYVKGVESDLVGEFTINTKQDDLAIKTYEPYHLEVTLDGRGDFKAIKPIEFEIDGVKIFNEEPIKEIELTKDGYVGSWNQKFAFVSEKDFTIPSVKIIYFDIQTQSLKELFIESRDIKVKAGFKKKELLDSQDESQMFDFSFVYYILTFLAGFLVAKIKFKARTKETKNDSYMQKINASKSLNELSMLLALKDTKKFNKLILEIESKNITSLDKAKKILESQEYR